MPKVSLDNDQPIAYWVGSHSPIAFALHQITAQGAILESVILWEVGEELSIELWLPGEVRHRMRAKVVSPSLHKIIGVQLAFLEVSPSAQAALERFLDRAPQ